MLNFIHNAELFAVKMFAINANDRKMLIITLEKLKSIDNENVILRISFNGENNFSKGNVSLKEFSTSVMGEKEEFYPEKGASFNEALRDALETTENKDIYLNTGYTIIEILKPISFSSVSATAQSSGEPGEHRIHCVPNLEALINYLNQVGAEYYNTSGDRPSDEYWNGTERFLNIGERGTRRYESTFCFTSKSQHFEMTRENAIKYIESIIEKKSIQPEYLRKSAEEESQIYILVNPPCFMPFIDGHKTATAPSTKQRILFIYDCFRNWINKLINQWVEIDFSQGKSFIYSTGTNSGWNVRPKEKIFTEKKIVLYPEYYKTNLWRGLNPLMNLDIEWKIVVTLGIIKVFGLKFDVKAFTGPIEDYIDRENFTFPERVKVISAKTNTSATSSSSQSSATSSSRNNSAKIEIPKPASKHK